MLCSNKESILETPSRVLRGKHFVLSHLPTCGTAYQCVGRLLGTCRTNSRAGCSDRQYNLSTYVWKPSLVLTWFTHPKNSRNRGKTCGIHSLQVLRAFLYTPIFFKVHNNTFHSYSSFLWEVKLSVKFQFILTISVSMEQEENFPASCRREKPKPNWMEDANTTSIEGSDWRLMYSLLWQPTLLPTHKKACKSWPCPWEAVLSRPTKALGWSDIGLVSKS